MIDIIRDNIQKEFVRNFKENGIAYHTNRAEDAPLPYVKLWELNTWSEEYKTHEEMFVRFTFWVWVYVILREIKNHLEMHKNLILNVRLLCILIK